MSSTAELYEVTFTAPAADGSTVTISPPTRLVIDKDGYPATAQNWDGNRASYTGNGWSYVSSNDTLTLSSGTYDFTSPELNPHGVAVNCPVTVDSNTTITNGIFLKEVTGSAPERRVPECSHRLRKQRQENYRF